MSLNEYQKAFYDEAIDFAKGGSPRLVYTNAVPGAGKTYMIVNTVKTLAKEYKKRSMVLAFNRTMSEELKKRIKKEKLEEFVETRTVHSFFLNGLKLMKGYSFSLAYDKSFFQKADIKKVISLGQIGQKSNDINKEFVLKEIRDFDESLLKEKNIDILFAMVNSYYSTHYPPKMVEKIEKTAKFFDASFRGISALEISDDMLDRFEKTKIKGLQDPKHKIFYRLIKNIEFLANTPYKKVKNSYYEDIPVQILDKEGNVVEEFKEKVKRFEFEDKHLLQVPHIYYYKNFYVESVKHPEILKKYLEGVDCLFVDEAQDNERVFMGILNVIMKNKIVNHIGCVGDTKQSIYSFKSAGHMDILSFIDKNKASIEKNYGFKVIESPVPYTYRFGKDLAECVNDIFRGIGSNIVSESKTSFFYPEGVNNEFVRKFIKLAKGESIAIITRSNYEAIRLYLHLSKDMPKTFRLNSSIKEEIREFRKKGVLAISDEKAKLEIIGAMQKEKPEYAGRMNFTAKELISSVKAKELLKKHGYGYLVDFTHGELETILSDIVRDSSKPVITTAHLSKGREFDYVFLSDDYYRNDFGDVALKENREKMENVVSFLENLIEEEAQEKDKDSLEDLDLSVFERDSEEDKVYFVAVTRAKKGVFQYDGLVYENIVKPVMDETRTKKMLENYNLLTQAFIFEDDDRQLDTNRASMKL